MSASNGQAGLQCGLLRVCLSLVSGGDLSCFSRGYEGVSILEVDKSVLQGAGGHC